MVRSSDIVPHSRYSWRSCAERPWSYSSEFTYPIPPRKPKIVKRIEKRVVDGVEQEVEVEVEEYEPIKRLFLFGGARD